MERGDEGADLYVAQLLPHRVLDDLQDLFVGQLSSGELVPHEIDGIGEGRHLYLYLGPVGEAKAPPDLFADADPARTYHL